MRGCIWKGNERVCEGGLAWKRNSCRGTLDIGAGIAPTAADVAADIEAGPGYQWYTMQQQIMYPLVVGDSLGRVQPINGRYKRAETGAGIIRQLAGAYRQVGLSSNINALAEQRRLIRCLS